jgi:hypothetical protein
VQLYQVKKLKTTHAIVIIFESFEIQTLVGNTAMLFLRKVQKSRKAFLKRLSKTWKPIKKAPFSFSLFKKVSLTV